MSRGNLSASLTMATLLLIAGPPAWTQGDLSADSPLAGESPLVELLLSQDWTREEMAQRLLQALEVASFRPEDCVQGEEMFSDVPATSTFCPWIQELARRGITSGCGGSNYCPAAAVNRQQMAVFLIRAIEAAVEGASEGPAGGDLVGSYPEPQIAPFAVTTEKLMTRAVTRSKIAAGAVGSGEIADGSVLSQHIADGNVTANDLGLVSVRARHLAPIFVYTRSIEVPPSSSREVTVPCEENEIAISGGARWPAANDAFVQLWIMESRPTGNSWTVRGGNPSQTTARTLQAYVSCLRP